MVVPDEGGGTGAHTLLMFLSVYILSYVNLCYPSVISTKLCAHFQRKGFEHHETDRAPRHHPCDIHMQPNARSDRALSVSQVRLSSHRSVTIYFGGDGP